MHRGIFAHRRDKLRCVASDTIEELNASTLVSMKFPSTTTRHANKHAPPKHSTPD